MKLVEYLESSRISQKAFGEMCGVSQAMVGQWLNRKVSAERAIQIERVTGGLVRCEELRPDVDWGYLRASGARLGLPPSSVASPLLRGNSPCFATLCADSPGPLPGAAPANLEADHDFPLPVQDDRRGGDQRSGQDRRRDERRGECDVQSGVRVDLLRAGGGA